MTFTKIAITSAFLLGTMGPLSAQTTTDLNTQSTTMDSLAGTQGGGKVVSKISSDYNSFLGSDATTVVTGLRNGTPIELTTTTVTPSTTPGGLPTTTTTTTTIIPPTGHMGYGNVYTSLALAKQQLADLGINQPTPEQLQAALTGGSVTTGTGTTATTTELQGILNMRASGMGWGEIAHANGYKLGPVISGMKSANKSLATTTVGKSTTHTTPTTGSESRGKGIVSGGGKSAKISTGGSSKGKSVGSGIVSGAGQSVGGQGHANGYGQGSENGIVSGSGSSVSHGNAYGHDKGGIVSGAGSSIGVSSGVVTGGAGGGHGMGQAKGKGHYK